MKRLLLVALCLLGPILAHAISTDENDYWTEETSTATIYHNTYAYLDYSTFSYSIKCQMPADLTVAQSSATAAARTFTVRFPAIDADVVAISTSCDALNIPTTIKGLVNNKPALVELALKIIARYHTLLDAESDLGLTLTAMKAQCIQAFSIIRKRYLLLP